MLLHSLPHPTPNPKAWPTQNFRPPLTAFHSVYVSARVPLRTPTPRLCLGFSLFLVLSLPGLPMILSLGILLH